MVLFNFFRHSSGEEGRESNTLEQALKSSHNPIPLKLNLMEIPK
jgi:hypothetical protein